MRRTSFSDMSCSIARCLEQIGDWWTLLLIREALSGTRRFGEFQSRLGIAPNVLTNRLQGLVQHGILQVAATSENGRALDYRLTDKGRDLFPVIVALAQWGDRHVPAPEGPPVQIVDRESRRPIAPLQVRSSDGRVLQARDVALQLSERFRLDGDAPKPRARD
jgi:DNA-binding HxlR family transcriptional regulator